jgi:hypothetical protein
MIGIFYGSIVYFGMMVVIVLIQEATRVGEPVLWALTFWLWIGLIGPTVAALVSDYFGD